MILVIGANSPIGLTVIRELGERGVPVLAHGTTSRALGRYSRHSRAFVCEPGPLADWLPRVVRDHDITAVMAISEHHLLQLTQLQGALGDCRVICPDAAQLELVLDKQRTLDVAARLGISVPQSWLPEAGEDFAAKAAVLPYPVAIKWPDPNAVSARLVAHGLDLEKVEYAATADALLAILRRYDPVGAWPLVQTWCPGYGLGQMLHMHGGRATLRFQHRRLREWPPSGGVSTLCEAVPLDLHHEQMALSETLLRAIDWDGPAMVEYRHDPATGTNWLMEINGRFWGSIPLAYHCGAHFGWETYRWQVFGETGEPAPCLRMRKARYVIPDLRHAAAILRDGNIGIGKRLRFLATFIASFADWRTRYYVWSIGDPMPFFGDMLGVVRKTLRLDRQRKAG